MTALPLTQKEEISKTWLDAVAFSETKSDVKSMLNLLFNVDRTFNFGLGAIGSLISNIGP